MPTILLVDDEPNILEVLEIVLSDEGMEVLKANNGRDALAILRNHVVDVVISDIKMPGFSGVELLREARPIAPDTVFIMVTAFASTDTAIEALQHGASDYITKPFRMEDVRDIVHRALAKRKCQKSQVMPSPDDLAAQQGQNLFQALHKSHVVGKSPE